MNMFRYGVLYMTAASVLVLTGGCAMMPMHGGMSHHNNKMKNTAMEQAVENQSVIMTVKANTLRAEVLSNIQVELYDKDIDKAMAGATITATLLVDDAKHDGHQAENKKVTASVHGDSDGLYVIPLKPQVAGAHILIVKVEELPDSAVALPLKLKTKCNVLPKEDKSSGDYVLPVLGAIGMAAMMVIMIL